MSNKERNSQRKLSEQRQTNSAIAFDNIIRAGRSGRQRLGSWRRHFKSTGTKPMPSKLSKTNLTWRAICRQSDPVLGIGSYRFAIVLAVSPWDNVCATTRAFHTDGHHRPSSAQRGTIARTSLVASIEKLPTNQRSLSISDQALSRKCEGSASAKKLGGLVFTPETGPNPVQNFGYVSGKKISVPMPKKKFNDEQIAFALRQADA